MSQGKSNKKVANGLVALSSAAVMAVYAAGYSRTRAAAELLETKSAERRPAAPAAAREALPPMEPAPAPTAQVEARASQAPVPALEAHQAAKPGAIPASALAAKPAPVAVDTKAAPVSLANVTEPAAGPAPVEIPAVPEPSVPAVLTQAPTVAAPVAPVAPAPPAPPVPPTPMWKDGTYLGWGTSRHGDIQAAVVIEAGRIASATIAQCLTRYSCSVIAKLPPEVPQRQSADVDYVSGATQSANAFYQAVVEALGKAK
jgi:uncharacterized protein with FMN-binding domain